MSRNIFLVAIGGAFGCVIRFLSVSVVSSLMPAAIPLGTLLVNIVSCFLIGLSVGLAERYAWLNTDWRIFLTAGFCGGMSTFSAFALENVDFLLEKNYSAFAVYTFLSVTLTIVAVFSGFVMSRQ